MIFVCFQRYLPFACSFVMIPSVKSKQELPPQTQQAQAQTQEFLFCRGNKLEGMYALPKLNTNSLRQVKGKRANIIASLKKRKALLSLCSLLSVSKISFSLFHYEI